MFNIFKILVIPAALLSAGAALAGPNLVSNGDFENGYRFNTEFNPFYGSANGPTGWASASFLAFNLYFDAATATTVSAQTQYGNDQQDLAPSFVASPTGGKFVALDGDSTNRDYLQQTINGLTAGKKYAVSFDWGASQLQNRTGPTTEQLSVGFGSATQTTNILANGSQGFNGWFHEKLLFTATDSSEVLRFLSLGTPVGLPPIAVLDGVSVTAVPEPAMWSLMIAGFGVVGIAARRRVRAVTA